VPPGLRDVTLAPEAAGTAPLALPAAVTTTYVLVRMPTFSGRVDTSA